MLKSQVGYSTNKDSYTSGVETARAATKNFPNYKLGFIFTSVKNNLKEVVKGIKSVTDMPIIGCTSSNGIIVPDGYINSEDGYTGILSLDDVNMTVGVAYHEAGNNPRNIGRKVAIAAVEDAKTTRAPSYFCMIASPKEEEEYLMGIQDVIGRVPMFGGSAADDDVSEKWQIICNDKVFNDGVVVAFFYTDNEIVTAYDGCYRETRNIGIITEVKDDRTLATIDGISALKKYANWTNSTKESLIGKNLLKTSITKPLGVKDPLGNLTVVRHPMFGIDQGTRTMTDDEIKLGNKVVENTAIIQLESTIDELIDATGDTLKKLRRSLYREPACYVLMHCGGRRLAINDRISEVHKQLLKEAKGVPFIAAFTFGEYGYDEHSANICGGLMLSFTAFGKE